MKKQKVKAKSSKNTICHLVLNTFKTSPTIKAKGMIQLVKKNFQKSAFNVNHYFWYKSQIKNGRYTKFFLNSKLGRRTLRVLRKVKIRKEKNRENQKLLGYIRKKLGISSNNENELFYNRRWIFARLQLDERKEKNIIKKSLFSKDSVRCYHCKRKIIIKKGIELHRKNGNKGYSKDNSVLVHRNCHQKLHKINE